MSSRSKPYGSEETRVRILDATWRLIEELGAGVRLADVAKSAGVSRQALYLHFGDRSGLFIAVVDHIDTNAGWSELRSYIFGASSGVESLQRWIEVVSRFNAKIDQAAQAIEANQSRDEAMAAAWRTKMNGRRSLVLAIVERIAGEGSLAPGWTPEDASDVIHAFTMPGPWRELTGELNWSVENFESAVWKLVSDGLIGIGEQ